MKRSWVDPHDALVAVATAVGIAVFIVRERTIAGAAGFPLDDSWIHLHFARNLAEGAGFSYNPGIPVAGSTAPLWTLLLGAVASVFGTGLVTVKAIGAVATAAAGIAVRRTAMAWGASRPIALAAAVGLVAGGPVVWGALSGMEVSLAAALVAAALLAHARRLTFVTALAAALAALARPEAIVLVPLFLLAAPWSMRRAAVFGVVTVVVLAPAVAFSLATVGAPLPATAAAKVEGGLLGWLGGSPEPLMRMLVERPRQFLAGWIAWLWSTHWLLPVVVLPAMGAAWWRVGRALGLPALALVLHPLAMALLAPYRDPGFQEGRYSIHLLPIAFVILAVAAPRHGTRLARAAVLVWLAIAVLRWPAAANRYAWGVQNINAMQVHLGHWVDRHLPQEARIAMNDIGAIAYVSRRHVIDLMGLVTPEIIAYRREGERGVIRYVREQCPDYVIMFPAWFPELSARRDLITPVYAVRLERNLVAGADEMVVYRFVRCAL